MADIHDNGRALAARLLAPRPAGKGAPMRLTRTVPGTRDPATGTTSPPTVTNYDGSGLRTQYDLKDVDGSQVLRTDVRMLVNPVLVNGASMPEAKPGDKLQFDGKVYTVINCTPLNYAGVVCGFVVQGRAA